MPPECQQNNLQVGPQPEVLKLSELAANLIARTILFQKMYQLPTFRYTALKDKIINVQVEEDGALNTIHSLPRTPNEAGPIGVEIKRRLAYKSVHQKAQLINPDQLYKAIDHLKKGGNPHYQFYDDLEIYEERCQDRDDDDIIAKALHPGMLEEDLIEELEELPTQANPNLEDKFTGEDEGQQET